MVLTFELNDISSGLKLKTDQFPLHSGSLSNRIMGWTWLKWTYRNVYVLYVEPSIWLQYEPFPVFPEANGTLLHCVLAVSVRLLGAVKGVSETHVPQQHFHVFLFFFPSPQFQLQMFDIVCSLGWTSRDRCCDLPSMVREPPPPQNTDTGPSYLTCLMCSDSQCFMFWLRL